MAATANSDSGTSTVERTRVQVVEGLGDKNGFDPTAIYEPPVAGVVTITSLFSKSDSLQDILGGGGAGQGSGFVLDERRLHRHERARVTNGTGSKLTKAKQVYVQFEDGNQVEAEIVGYDPNADVGVVKVDPKGLDLVPLSLGHIANVRVGEPVAAIGSPFGEQGSLSIGVVSAKNRTIEALTDFSISRRDPDRRGDQPRQLRRPAARRARPGDRHQLPDPLLRRRQRRRRLRGLGGQRAPLDRADPRAGGKARYAYIGISSQNALSAARRQARTCRSTRARWSPTWWTDGPADKAGIKGGGKEIRFQAIAREARRRRDHEGERPPGHPRE